MSAISKLFGLALDDALTSVRKGGGRGTVYDQGAGDYVPAKTVDPELVIGPKGLKSLAMSDRMTEERFQDLNEKSKIARDMFKRGKSNDEIIAKTGYMVDEKGQLQLEIDDTNSALLLDPTDVSTSKNYKLGEVFDHPDFFAAYPNFKNINVQFYEGKNKKDKGSFNPNTNLLRINKNRDEFITGGKPEEVISTVLHESQHAIQVAENFIKGGSWKQFIKGDPDKASDAEQQAAFRKYLSIMGEAQARNVELRYILNYMAKNKNSKSLLQGKNFWETLLKDPQSVEKDLRLGELTDEGGNFVDFRSEEPPVNSLEFQDPFTDTTKEL